MSFEDEREFEKDMLKKADESKQSTFDSWLVDLEEGEQPEACNIDDPDCENCGS
tara:strand:- start:557 stop:718 length:162 start_codon:yes stop_codon:yes gene_type:complete